MYVPTPGTTGPLRALDECLAALHDRSREAAQARRDQRARDGIPLDDDTDQDAARAKLDEAQTQLNAGDTRGALEAVSAALSAFDPPPDVPAEYEPKPHYEGVRVRLRATTARRYAETINAVRDCARRIVEGDGAALPDLADAQRDFVRCAVAEVVGLESDDGPIAIKAAGDPAELDDVALTLLEAGGLMPDLFAAARGFQELDPMKRRQFGV